MFVVGTEQVACPGHLYYFKKGSRQVARADLYPAALPRCSGPWDHRVPPCAAVRVAFLRTRNDLGLNTLGREDRTSHSV